MMAAIFNSAIFDSAILHKTLIETNSIWLKLIHSHSTWWWQPSWILPSCIQPFCTKKNFTHSFWFNLMMVAIFNFAILDSTILHKTLTQTNSIWLKLIHSYLTWWWQPSSILAILDSTILAQNSDSYSLTLWLKTHWLPLNLMMAAKKNLLHIFPPHHFAQKIFTHSFWLNLIMAAILNSDNVEFRPFCTNLWIQTTFNLTQTHSFWFNFMMVAILNSAIFDSATLHKTQIKLIQYDSNSFLLTSTWWWQPSWIWPSWIQPS